MSIFLKVGQFLGKENPKNVLKKCPEIKKNKTKSLKAEKVFLNDKNKKQMPTTFSIKRDYILISIR